MPEIKIVLIVLTMIKLLFFLRVFEEFAFLVNIIQKCCMDIGSFIVAYIMFLLIFTMAFMVLDMELDEENASI